MLTIWKFQLEPIGFQTVTMPAGARCIRVGGDPLGALCVWAIVDVAAPKVERAFRMAGTGHELTKDGSDEQAASQLGDVDRARDYYLATVTMGGLVFHFFDLGER